MHLNFSILHIASTYKLRLSGALNILFSQTYSSILHKATNLLLSWIFKNVVHFCVVFQHHEP